MNREEAKRLAIRIANSWHGGPSVDEWTSELVDMDPGTAGTTFVRLRRQLDHAPSIAHYWRTYRELTTTSTDTQPCNDCDGSGWITSHTDQRGYRYSKPCPHCRNGEHTTKIDMRPHGAAFAALDAARRRHPAAHQLEDSEA